MEDKPKKPHCCPHEGCTAAFNRPYRLAQHVLVHNNVKAFVCLEENCSRSYTSKSHLDRHMSSVHKVSGRDIIYSCPTCLKKYANRQNLKRHIKIKHNIKRPVTFTCDTCKIEYRKKNQLSAHMYSHTGIKAFSCELCLKEFISLAEKKRHAHSHRIHSCEKCTLKFKHWSKYQKHLRTDHEYICNECGRSFKQRVLIVRHIKNHNSPRQYPCPYENCARIYSRNSNLKQHIVIKHKKITHSCKICDAQLCTKSKLDKHMLKFHSGKPYKKKAPRTTATGRKLRKDLGISKIPMASQLAGLPKEFVETCSSLNAIHVS